VRARARVLSTRKYISSQNAPSRNVGSLISCDDTSAMSHARVVARRFQRPLLPLSRFSRSLLAIANQHFRLDTRGRSSSQHESNVAIRFGDARREILAERRRTRKERGYVTCPRDREETFLLSRALFGLLDVFDNLIRTRDNSISREEYVAYLWRVTHDPVLT